MANFTAEKRGPQLIDCGPSVVKVEYHDGGTSLYVLPSGGFGTMVWLSDEMRRKVMEALSDDPK